MIVEFLVDEPWESSGSRMALVVTNMESDRVWTVSLQTSFEKGIPVIGSIRPRHTGESLASIAEGLEVASNLVLAPQENSAEGSAFTGRTRLLT